MWIDVFILYTYLYVYFCIHACVICKLNLQPEERNPTVHCVQLRKFFPRVLSMDRTCLSWCVELAALELCSASFQRDLHAQVYLLRRIIAKDSANFQNCTMEAMLLKEFRDLRALFEKEVVTKVKEPLVWQRK